MLKQISYFFIIAILILSAVSHLLKLLYLFFKPQILAKYQFISNRTHTKLETAMYYILTVGVSIYIINLYIIKLKTGT